MAVKKKVEKEPKTSGANIDDTIKAIQAKFGEGSIMKLGDKPKVGIDAIPTGSIGLDYALGVGGLPRGRIIEIFGPESSGKTTLSLHVIAEAQKLGGICAFVDAEHAMDPEYSKKLGVNIDELLISQPDTGEQALEITESLVRSGKIAVVVIDSVAALTPKDEIEGDMGAHHVGKQARLMSQALRKLTAIVDRSNTLVDSHADWRDVWQPRNNPRREGAQVLYLRPSRHSPYCANQKRRRRYRRTHQSKGG
jgi:recombination protein RecA